MIPQAPGRPVRQSQGHPTRRWLESVGIWAAGEGSLSLRVENKLNSMRSWRGREGSGDQERSEKGSGGNYEHLLEEGVRGG